MCYKWFVYVKKTICKYYDNLMDISYTLNVEINGGFRNVILNFLIKYDQPTNNFVVQNPKSPMYFMYINAFIWLMLHTLTFKSLGSFRLIFSIHQSTLSEEKVQKMSLRHI